MQRSSFWYRQYLHQNKWATNWLFHTHTKINGSWECTHFNEMASKKERNLIRSKPMLPLSDTWTFRDRCPLIRSKTFFECINSSKSVFQHSHCFHILSVLKDSLLICAVVVAFVCRFTMIWLLPEINYELQTIIINRVCDSVYWLEKRCECINDNEEEKMCLTIK